MPRRCAKTSNFPGVWRLCVLLAVSFTACRYANAQQAYTALSDPAISVKQVSRTPLISIIRVANRFVAVGQHGVIILSNDDGASWAQAAVPVSLSLTSVYFADPLHGWAVGHYGAILQTNDGGLTWRKDLDGLDVIAALTRSANQTKAGTASSPDSQLKQKVANAFTTAGPSKPFLTIGKCGNGILAAGQQDMAMFSQDGGGSWQEWTSHISDQGFRNIYAILDEGDVTILIGEGGLVLESAGSCADFKPVNGPYSATLFGGLNIDSTTILLYGLDGSVFKSGDNGATWQALAMPADAVIVDGLMIDSGRVLLATLGGRLYLSDSRVETFQQLGIAEPFEIAGMTRAANGDIIVVGEGGVARIPVKSISIR